MKRPLAYYGNPILRKKADIVETLTEETQILIQDMTDTMHAHNGIGLAAPQISIPLALFITEVPLQDDDDSWSPGALRVFINPKIIHYSEEEDLREEGCLSIPGVHGNVWRPKQVTVEALDQEGKPFTEAFQGLQARAILHENDHLNGTLYIDRMNKKDRLQIEKKLKALKKKCSQ